MAAFLRPGERQAGAFGVSFAADRSDAAENVQAVVHNPNERLALADQRRRLPVYKHRPALLRVCL